MSLFWLCFAFCDNRVGKCREKIKVSGLGCCVVHASNRVVSRTVHGTKADGVVHFDNRKLQFKTLEIFNRQ